MKIIDICKQCGREFFRIQRNRPRKFCSNRCFGLSVRGVKQKWRTRKNPLWHECRNCRKKFYDRHACKTRTPKFCSTKCAAARIIKWHVCKNCGKRFHTYQNKSRGGIIFCSNKCFGEFHRGMPLSKEHRKKLSIIKKSNPQFYTRQLHTPQVKKKVADAMRARMEKTGHRQPWIWGEKHWDWKGGKRISEQGYRLLLREHGGKYQLEQRNVMEKYLGRKLVYNKPKGQYKEIVRRVDGDKLNNDIDNLVLTFVNVEKKDRKVIHT